MTQAHEEPRAAPKELDTALGVAAQDGRQTGVASGRARQANGRRARWSQGR